MATSTPTILRRTTAEFVGTFWLVFAGCGAVVIGGNAVTLPAVGLAFGVAVMTMAYAIGHISGCHLNPAVSVGLCAGGRFPAKDLPAYIAAQVLGAITGAGVLYLIATGKAGFSAATSGLASNGYAEHSPEQYSMMAGLITEIVLTAVFLWIIMGATDRRAPQGFAPIAIGLGLALIIIVGGHVTNLSVNPARSTGPAIFVRGWALQQLWLFWVAPLIGGALGGAAYTLLVGQAVESPTSPLEKLSQQSEARAIRAEQTV